MNSTMPADEALGAASPPPPAARPLGGTLWTLLRRELWEHRYLYRVPLVFVALVLLLAVFANGELQVPAHITAVLSTMIQWGLALLLFMIVACVIGYYALDCLSSERRDRSILFWKSLPVSDGLTVTSKFLVAALVIPLATLALALLGQLLFVGILSARAAMGNLAFAPGWDTLEWLRNCALMLLVLLLAVLWYAPLVAGALLLSATVKKPFLWVTLPPIMVLILEPVFFHTQYFWQFLQYRTNGVWQLLVRNADLRPESVIHHSVASTLYTQFNLRAVLANSDLWLGVVAALLMLYVAARVRRYHDEN
jgi:ABC-2 type transport system permease protein